MKNLAAHLRVLHISESSRGPNHPLTLLSLGNIAKTYAAQGNVEEALKYQARVDAVIERNIQLNVALGSERQKLSYLNAVAERTDRTISLNVDLAPSNAAASALAALVLIQRKGRVLDAMSESFASLRQRSTPEEQIIIERYNKTTAELARLVLNGPQSISFEEHKKKVSELQEQQERLEAEISHRSAEFRAGSQPVTLAAVQAVIPTNAALIEFAVYRPFNPRAESNREAYGEPRYIAYIVRMSGQVRWCDLGDAKAIEEATNGLRQALRDPLRFDGRDLLRMQVRRESTNKPTVVANPLFGEAASPQIMSEAMLSIPSKRRRNMIAGRDLSELYFAPLGGTEREADSIHLLFPEAKLMTGAEASESA